MKIFTTRKAQNSITRLFIFVVVSVLINSCYIEKKLGKNFADNANNISLLILEPDLVIKSNIKNNDSDTSAISECFNNLQEKALSDAFMDELKKQLINYRINVFTSNRIDTFFTLPSPAYLFNIAQLEIEAYYYPFKEQLVTDSLIYNQEFLLNAFNLNTWFEFSELNSEKKAEVLFSNFYIKDEIAGNFKVNLFSDEVNYVYNRKNLTSEDIQFLIKYAGKTNAQYIFNHLVNQYIKDKIGERFNDKYFYYYDHEKNKILFLENYTEFKKIK